MKYFGPELEFPLAESGVKLDVEEVTSPKLAEVMLGKIADIEDFVQDGTGVVVLSATADEVAHIKNRSMLIGAHAVSEEGAKILEERFVRCYPMLSMTLEGLPAICDALMGQAKVWPKLQVIVSQSILDSAFSDGGKPGGLSVRETLYVIQRLSIMHNYQSALILGTPSPLTGKLIIEAAPKPQNTQHF